MRRQDFEQDAWAISSVTIADLKQAEKEEAAHIPISNPRVHLLRKHVFATSGRVKGSDKLRASYRGQIWGTTLKLCGPSLWITINPNDLHDPVAQILIGEEIDMDKFFATAGPDSDHRARNIAKDPYGAAKYFFFIIHAVLSALFGIEVTKDHVHSSMGILGVISAYYGVVEAQGRGTLHLHMLLWLAHTPNSEEMHEFLKTEEFRDRIQAYIKQNIRAHVDGLDEETVRTTPRETQLGYSRPPNPDGTHWEAECADKERRVVRSQQVHTCTKSTCLRYNKHGRLVCKRRAPWELSDTEYIDENGNWKPKRTHPYINNYCPAISVSLCCNNNIKLLTNGVDTKHASWYSTDYQTKKQNKNNNVSALMAQSLMYHEQHSNHLECIGS